MEQVVEEVASTWTAQERRRARSWVGAGRSSAGADGADTVDSHSCRLDEALQYFGKRGICTSEMRDV